MPFYCCPRCGRRAFRLCFDEISIGIDCVTCYLHQTIIREELGVSTDDSDVAELITFFDKLHAMLQSNPERTG